MTRFIFSLLITLMTLTTYAQKDVTKFLGIPVDGTKAEMIQKLKAKGFKSSYINAPDILEGQFNGNNVTIHIATNGNKVWRVMVADKISFDATDIKIKFNTLCKQFENNHKYMSMLSDKPYIPEDEDIQYQTTINKKRYSAGYYQKPEAMINPSLFSPELDNIFHKKYTKEQLANPSDEIQADCEKIKIDYLYNILSNKIVWFMISEDGYNKYSIYMYYDNLYNQANGEDL